MGRTALILASALSLLVGLGADAAPRANINRSEMRDEGTSLRPRDPTDDCIRLSGAAGSPRICSLDDTTLCIDTDDDLGTCEITIDADGTLQGADLQSTGGNRIAVLDHDQNVTPDPTCANKGTPGTLTILDVDESASDQWQVCDGTSILFDFSDPRDPAIYADDFNGDGTHDGTDLTSALAACASAGGGTIILPDRTPETGNLGNTQFTVSPNCILKGSGLSTTLEFNHAAGGNAALTFDDFSGCSGVVVNITADDASSIGIALDQDASGVHRFQWDRCYARAQNELGVGLRAEGALKNAMLGGDFQGWAWAVDFHAATGPLRSNANSLLGVEIRNNAGGVRVNADALRTLDLSSSVIEDNDTNLQVDADCTVTLPQHIECEAGQVCINKTAGRVIGTGTRLDCVDSGSCIVSDGTAGQDVLISPVLVNSPATQFTYDTGDGGLLYANADMALVNGGTAGAAALRQWDDAAGVTYTPTTASDWIDPDPAHAAEGLDDLASRVQALDGGTEGALAAVPEIFASDYGSLQAAFDAACVSITGPKLVIDQDYTPTATTTCGTLTGSTQTVGVHIQLASGSRINWGGAAGGTMFQFDGMQRVTLDIDGIIDGEEGGNRAGEILEFRSDDDTNSSEGVIRIDGEIRDADVAIDFDQQGVSGPDDQLDTFTISGSILQVGSCYRSDTANARAMRVENVLCSYKGGGTNSGIGLDAIAGDLSGANVQLLGQASALWALRVQDYWGGVFTNLHFEGEGGGVQETGSQTFAHSLTLVNPNLLTSTDGADLINWDSTTLSINVIGGRMEQLDGGETFDVLIPNGIGQFGPIQTNAAKHGTITLGSVSSYASGDVLLPGGATLLAPALNIGGGAATISNAGDIVAKSFTSTCTEPNCFHGLADNPTTPFTVPPDGCRVGSNADDLEGACVGDAGPRPILQAGDAINADDITTGTLLLARLQDNGPTGYVLTSSGGGGLTLQPPATGSALDVKKDGGTVVTDATAINFLGSGFSVVQNGTEADVTNTGGGGGGGGAGVPEVWVPALNFTAPRDLACGASDVSPCAPDDDTIGGEYVLLFDDTIDEHGSFSTQMASNYSGGVITFKVKVGAVGGGAAAARLCIRGYDRSAGSSMASDPSDPGTADQEACVNTASLTQDQWASVDISMDPSGAGAWLGADDDVQFEFLRCAFSGSAGQRTCQQVGDALTGDLAFKGLFYTYDTN